MWVLDYLNDIDADFRAFYRFPERGDMPGVADGEFGEFTSPRFFRMVERLGAYNGVIAARIVAEKEKEKEPPQRLNAGPKNSAQDKVHVRLSQLMLIDPTLIQYEQV